MTGTGRTATWLPEHEAKELLRAAGIAVPYGLAVDGEDDAVAAWRELDGPVALKLSAGAGPAQDRDRRGGAGAGLRGRRAPRPPRDGRAGRRARRRGPGRADGAARRGADRRRPHRRGGARARRGAGRDLDRAAARRRRHPAARRPRAHRARHRHAAGRAAAARGPRGRGGPGVDVAAAATLAARVGRLLLERSLATVECNPVLVGEPGGGAVAVDAAIRMRGRS